MFQGRFEHTVDEKGRIAIPAAFRRRLINDSGTGSAVITIWDRCLAAFPMNEWEIKVAAISKMNQLDTRVNLLKRVFIGCAQECPIDKNGRLLLPLDLRRDSQIEKECIIIGQIEKFEIWSLQNWQQTFSQMAMQIGNIFSALAENGIKI